jgi:L-seryl-tRNA(Ser) seleniumtransferase
VNGPHDARLALPAVAALLATDEARALLAARTPAAVTALAREILADLRAALLRGELAPDRASLLREARARLVRVTARPPRPLPRVINGTGVVLHTNLGRAPLGPEVLDDVREASLGYAALEYDLAKGRRGHRDGTVRAALCALTGADDALVVNNGAAAVLLACTALAAGREVVVSRGELVEIGGGFRIPEVIAACGATLVEVGATNRTYARDFERALGPRTAALLRVHTSNFSVRGFTAAPDNTALSALAARHGVPLLVDLGSGALLDTRALGLPAEPTARDALREGAAAVMFSGDKLLGGPQAGIVVGRAETVARMREHPLMRALRPGRLVLAALGAVLQRYVDGRATRELPALRALGEPEAAVRARAEALREALGVTGGVSLAVVPTVARVGGGTLPDAEIPSWALRVTGPAPHRLDAALRAGSPAVVARAAEGALWIDLRTVGDHEADALATATRSALASLASSEHALSEGAVAPMAHEEEG